MRIVVHDYSGHPFQVELSRALAGRGHEVLHLYCKNFLTPHGSLEPVEGDPDTLRIEAIHLERKVDKSNVFKRRLADIEHGRRAAERILAFKPDVILSANSPLDAQKMILRTAHQNGIRFAFWVQDLFGQAIKRLMAGKYFGVGSIAGSHYVALENRMLIESDLVIVIAQDFVQYLPAEIQNDPKVHVVENWAPLSEIPVRPNVNDWGRQHGFSEGLNFLYSGTLGMKHNPELLIQLAKAIGSQKLPFQSRARLIVVSEGPTIEFLERRKAELALDNLQILPFQPFSAMPDMLATADVLVAILEPDAGVFAVPSKVLTYLCAAKPLLLAIPPENLAAQIVLRAGAGLVSPPTDTNAFLANAGRLLNDESYRERLGANARNYAEKTFDIGAIANRFVTILSADPVKV